MSTGSCDQSCGSHGSQPSAPGSLGRQRGHCGVAEQVVQREQTDVRRERVVDGLPDVLVVEESDRAVRSAHEARAGVCCRRSSCEVERSG